MLMKKVEAWAPRLCLEITIDDSDKVFVANQKHLVDWYNSRNHDYVSKYVTSIVETKNKRKYKMAEVLIANDIPLSRVKLVDK